MATLGEILSRLRARQQQEGQDQSSLAPNARSEAEAAAHVYGLVIDDQQNLSSVETNMPELREYAESKLSEARPAQFQPASISESESGYLTNLHKHDSAMEPLSALGGFAETLNPEEIAYLAKYGQPYGLEPVTVSDEGDEGTFENIVQSQVTGYARRQGGFFKRSSGEETEGLDMSNNFVTSQMIREIEGAGSGHLLDGEPEEAAASAPEESNSIKSEIHRILNATNRFSPDSSGTPYINEGKLSKGGLFSIQRQMGSFDPHTLKVVNAQHMRKLAAASLVAATGHADEAKEFSELSNRNDIFGSIQFSFIAPTLIQFGFNEIDPDQLGILSSELAAEFGFQRGSGLSDFLADLEIGDYPDTGNSAQGQSFYSKRYGTSYGSLNSPVEYFDNFLPFGMFVPAIIGLVALMAIAAFFELIINMIRWFGDDEDNEQSDKPDYTKPHLLAFGENAESRSGYWGPLLGDLLRFLGWPSQNYGFMDNFSRGLAAFIGLPAGRSLFDTISENPTSLVDVLIDLMQAPGYYLIIIRSIARSFAQIGEAFSKVSGSLAGIFTTLPNAIITMAETDVFRFIVRILEIGEIAGRAYWEPGVTGGPNFKNAVEAKTQQTLTPFNRNSLSRHIREDNDVKSPLSLSRFPAIYRGTTGQTLGRPGPVQGIKSEEFQKLVADFKRGKFTASQMAKLMGPVSLSEKDRIMSNVVEEFEDLADAEYMPFYIQDVRTREMISMPAFITSIDDSYSVDYQTTSAFGRVDPVKIHQNTTRTISLSFKLVAMSGEDHDYMWFVINKLTSMLYPQRSIGAPRELALTSTGKSVNFISPYSSVPTSTPLVRIRLGEVLHSNYSEESYKAMMGAGSRHFGIFSEGGTRDKSIPQMADVVKEVETKFQQFIRGKGVDPIIEEQESGNLQDRNYTIKSKTTNLDNLHAQLAGRVVILPPGTRVFLYPKNKNKPSPIPMPPGVGEDSSGTTKVRASVKINQLTKVRIAKVKTVILTEKNYNEWRKENPTANPSDFPVKVRTIMVLQTNIPSMSQEEIRQVYGNNAENFVRRWKNRDKDKEVHMYLEPSDDNAPYVVPTPADIKDTYKMLSAKDKDQLAVKAGSKDAASFNFETTYAAALKESNFLHSNIVQSQPTRMAFKSSGGKGLAGVITGMTLNYGDSTWETKPGQRAPQQVEVSLSFEPMHDIAPGLRHDGDFTPAYPVGTLNRNPHENEISQYMPGGEKNKYARLASEAKDPPEAATEDKGFLP